MVAFTEKPPKSCVREVKATKVLAPNGVLYVALHTVLLPNISIEHSVIDRFGEMVCFDVF